MQNRHFTYLLILAMFLWGGGWSALKILTYDLSMPIIVFWRFFIMSLTFIPILYLMKKPLVITASGVKFVAFSSVLNIAFMVSSFYGVSGGTAGSGGVIITTLSPIVTFVFVTLIFKSKLSINHYIGLSIGLVGGVVMLELHDFTLFLNSSNIYFLLCAVIWAGVTILAQHSHQHMHPVHYSFYISIVATIASFIYAYDSDLSVVFEQGKAFWIALIYLSVLGQSVATTIFFIASGRLGSQKTSSFMFLVPLFSLLIAWILLDEEIESQILIGGCMSLLAVYFINKKS